MSDKVTCPMCSGSGVLVNDKTGKDVVCGECGGTGKTEPVVIPPSQLKSNSTVRAYILAERWIDVTHEGWTLRISSPQGVSISPNRDGSITVSCATPIKDDEI